MHRVLLRFLTAIQLTRLTMAFGAISDVWFVILLTKAQTEYVYIPVRTMPLWAGLLAGATVAVGLFAYGAALNDVLDVRHDAAFSPQRPIPAGRIRIGQAIVIIVGALLVAMLGGIALGLGAAGVTLITATGILFYNAAGKFIPAVGITTLGLIHAAHMLIPNHQLMFTLPIWLVMTHTMVIGAIVHKLEDKRPRLDRTAIVATVFAWIAWSSVILVFGARDDHDLWPDYALKFGWVYPLAAMLAFAAVAWWKAGAARGENAAEKLKRYGAMWQALYGAAWLAALGLNAQALALGAFAIAGFAAMTIIREVRGLSDRPVGFR